MNAVYVAGRGLACALGHDLPASLAALQRGGVAPTPVEVAPGLHWPMHAMPREAGSWLERLRRSVCDVVAQSGVVARPGTPMFVASSSFDIGCNENEREFAGDMHTFADVVARAFRWPGPVFTVSTACTSAVNAVLAAADFIRSGDGTEALVLGIEFSNRFTVAGFGGMQLLSPDRARPFGAGRNGLVLGEAVAALHLRATPARWRLAGGANVVDGSNPTGIEARAVITVCHEALRRSGLAPSDIDLVRPQAAGSPANDAIEAAALKQVFGTLPPMVTLKSSIGHTLGASGAAELALLTACLESGSWPAVDHAPDPALDVVLVTQAPAQVRHILLNAVGFGGGHAAIVLEDCGA